MAEDLQFTPVVSVTRRNRRTRERERSGFFSPLCSLKSGFNLGSDVDGWGGQKMGPIRGIRFHCRLMFCLASSLKCT